MTHPVKMVKRPTSTRTAIVAMTCFLYLTLTIFYYHIDKYTTGNLFIVLTLLIPIAFIIILFHLIRGTIWILMRRRYMDPRSLLPVAIALITLSYSIFSPYRYSSEAMESNVVLRACYEGTQDQATLKFRKDQTFELHWTGPFFGNNWHMGTYKMKGDTIYLNYTTTKSNSFGDTLVINGQGLITINKMHDNTQHFVPFYLGHCKGSN